MSNIEDQNRMNSLSKEQDYGENPQPSTHQLQDDNVDPEKVTYLPTPARYGRSPQATNSTLGVESIKDEGAITPGGTLDDLGLALGDPVQDDNRNIVDEEANIPTGFLAAAEDKHESGIIIAKRPQGIWWYLYVASMLFGSLVYGLDTTIAANIQPAIYLSLGDIDKLSWIGTGFVLGAVCSILFYANLFSIFQFKWTYTVSYILFTVGSALCGAAHNMNMMIAGRVIAGLGGAGIYLGDLNYINITTTIKERPMYEAGLGVCWGFGAIIGPLIGGGLAQTGPHGWRWAFYILVIGGGILSAYVALFFPFHNPAPEIKIQDKLKAVDWLGALLNAAWYCLFVLVLAFAGTSWRWQSGGTIALWVLWGVVTVAYAVQQWLCIFTTAERRIFPVKLLKNKLIMIVFLQMCGISASLWVTVYFTPLFFQFTLGDDAVKSAVKMLPLIVLMIFFIIAAGGSITAVQRPAPYYMLGGSLALIGGALMTQLDPETHIRNIYGYLVLLGAGAGMCLQIGYAVAAAMVPPADVAAAIAFLNVGQIGTGALCLGIAGSVFQNVGKSFLSGALASYNFSAQEIAGALAGADSAILSGHADPRVRELAIAAVDRVIAREFYLCIAGAALVVVCAAGMSWRRMPLGMPVD